MQKWEDSELKEWNPNDYRIWVGNLGNEVTDNHLYAVYSKYDSFQKCKVVRDKLKGYSKGFGFVSFSNG